MLEKTGGSGLNRAADKARSHLREVIFGSLLAAILGGALPAQATLGRSYASVEADRAHLAARLTSTAKAAYTVHEITLPNGGVTREFTRSDGVVFAVVWRGPSRPDLRQLFGDYFDVFQTENAARGVRRTRAPLTVNHSDFIARSGGRPGGFSGLAFLPQLAPAGVSAADLQEGAR